MPVEAIAWADWFRMMVIEARHEPRVVVVSTEGRHQPLTLGRFLIWVAKKLGYHVVGPWHLQQHTWGDLCHTCKMCDPNDPNKDALFYKYCPWA